MNPRQRFANLFRGPSRGLSPKAHTAKKKHPHQTACIPATIFSDCFSLCAGMISGAAPGPVCGWTFIEPFGALGGFFTFTPGVMSMDTAGATEFPIAIKPLPATLASVLGISGQFDFTEYPTPPNAETTYQIFLLNSDLSELLSISFFGDGSAVVQAGAKDSVPTYLGAWTPSGDAHRVHFSIPETGTPELWLDGVEIVLTFFGDVATFDGYPADSISYGGGAAVMTPASSPLRRIFLTAGESGPETNFCCPCA